MKLDESISCEACRWAHARVDTGELAILLDCSEQWIRTLAQRGVLDRDEEGLFELQVSLFAYLGFLRHGAP